MGAVASALGTIGAVIAIGSVLGRLGVLGDGAEQLLARIVFVVATPCLLMVTIARSDLGLLVSRTALVTVVSTSVVALLAVLVLRLVLHRSAGDVVIGTLASSYVNVGNLGIPLAVYLLGSAVAVVPTLLFQLLVIAPVAFVVLDSDPSAALGTAVSGPGRSGPRPGAVIAGTLHNPVIIGTLLGVALSLAPWHLPGGALEPFRLIGVTAAPLALIAFGMTLSASREPDARFFSPDVMLAVVLRSTVHPLLALVTGRALGLGGLALLTVVTMAALPTAQNVLVYALRYRRGVGLARDAGLVTTVLAAPVLVLIAIALTPR